MSAPELELLFAGAKDDPEILRKIHGELQHRTTARAKTLKKKVEEKLSKGGCQISPSVPTTPPSIPIQVPNDSYKDKQSEIDIDIVAPRTGAGTAQHVLSISKPFSPPNYQSQKTISKKDDGRYGQPPTCSSSSEFNEKPPQSPTRIRPPGNLKGLPDKFHFELKKDIKLGLDPKAPLIKRYEAGLKALIVEMRKKGAGVRQVILENGESVKLDGREVGYQFPFEGDANLFEGASVVAIVGGNHTEGRIVAVLEKRIVISLESDFGPRISYCILRVDNTAMLEALRMRLENIGKGEVQEFNKRLAEAVIGNIGDEQPSENLSEYITIDLNRCQREAVCKIASNEVFYLWGPPGTGKTKTLSTANLFLLQGSKKVLLCSNTNQAVDQVLLNLCKKLGRFHDVLENGQIVRIGKISHRELEDDWSSYVTIDGIVDRKSAALRERKTELEHKLEQINREATRTIEIGKRFEFLDQIEAELKQLLAEHDDLRRNADEAKSRREQAERKMTDLRAEKERIKTAILTRIFRRTAEEVERDIQIVSMEISRYAEESDEAIRRVNEIAPAVRRKEFEKNQVVQSLLAFDRRIIEKEIEELETRKQPVNDEIADINRQLSNIAKAVLEQARIIGATVTKAFLSPQLFSNFDVVIVDEASMVMLPALFYAAGLSKGKVIISGDFRQLPPIVQTEQKEIYEAIGGDVFQTSGLTQAFSSGRTLKRAVMLDEQYRMDEKICKLISSRMYKGKLKTSSSRNPEGPRPPEPFNGALTVIDTSTIMPFSNRDPFKSRYNLMHALAVRNLCLDFKRKGLVRPRFMGICTPYAAQATIAKRILEGAGLDFIEAGTIHKYQGDEKTVMILDIPDSYGEKNAGIFLQADQPDDDGAKLFNVAISRAKNHLIVIANLAYLDAKLPNHAVLRGMLADVQAHGNVVDVRDVLGLWPIMEDLGHYGRSFDLSASAEKTGLFNQKDFDVVSLADFEGSRKSIVIYSGFITEQRVAVYESIFRRKILQGHKIRCVTRPPRRNGNIPEENGKAALNGLEMFGCVVDTRGDIHEKVVIIDDEIVWFGSLNPLSHTAKTAEVMARVVGKQIALQLVAFLALDKGMKPDEAEGISTRKENPRCPKCGARVAFMKGRYGPYWECEDCEWRENVEKQKKSERATTILGSQEAPMCPECGAPTNPRTGPYGAFYGCSRYPNCSGTVKNKGRRGKKKKKGT